jgi:hypothetical protein
MYLEHVATTSDTDGFGFRLAQERVDGDGDEQQ